MKKRIAVFSDVHGNLSAFQAMYEDSVKQHADEYWFIGDLLMPGPSVMAVWKLFKQMAPAVIVRGNWDDLVVRGARGMMDLARPSHVYFARLAQYVAKYADSAIIDEIASWPMRVTKRVGGLNFGISHNLPVLNMGQDLFPTQATENFDKLFKVAGEPVDVAIYAHVHHDLMRYGSDERIVLNPGAIGEPFNHWQPLQRDLRAHYLLLEVDDLGLAETSFRHVQYNRQDEKKLADASDLPYRDLYKKMMVTGRAYTHDAKLLTSYNKRYPYAAEYQAYAKKLNR